MSKGEERRVLKTGERSLGGQERGISPFPLTSISSPFYQSLISQTLTPDSSAHLVASLHLKTDGKLQHNLKVRKIVK